MGKKVREYKSGDFIFAKVKGYPAWPARVQRPNGKKYFVYFYGTGETANLAPTMIFDYAENKEKFLTKTVKRRDFNDGVKQIEHDFANNVPLEEVVGLPVAAPEETSANNTLNDSANETADDTMAMDTTVDETLPEENTTQNAVEDSDDTGALVIDEGKQKARKSVAKTPAKELKAKEPKTPRGKAKKDDGEEAKEDEKKDEEIVSRSGRKIRPKRYLDEHTEDNTTLPSPAPKKKRAGSPAPEKEKKEVKETQDKNMKLYNTIPQSELEDLKEPYAQDTERENILIAYLPSGEYVGVKLFQSRPTSFKNEAARLQWDKQAAANAITLKTQLERGQISYHSILSQLVMDLNLSDEEKATLDKERETEEKKSRVQFLKTEMKLIELDAKIKTCLCLEKADTELCLKLLDELMDLDVKPLMLLKHPSCLETIKRMRAYVGNTPSWDLSESAVLLFSQHAHRIRRQADTLYTRTKGLFTVPEGLSFWEYFTERVAHFKKVTAKLSSDELLEMVHEPLEMSTPAAYNMKAAIDAANEEESIEDDSKKKAPGKGKKANNTPAKTPAKRQKKQEENKKSDDKEEVSDEVPDSAEINDKEDSSIEKEKDSDAAKESEDNEVTKENTDKKSQNSEEKDAKKEAKEKKSKNSDDKEQSKYSDKKRLSTDNAESKKDQSNQKRNSIDEKSKNNKSESSEEKNESNTKDDEKGANDTDKTVNRKESTEQTDNNVEDKDDKVKDKEDEPKAKRSRESKKTEPPPPRSPTKRKSKA
ncbi:PC4 and SFRS1-interacting protein [Aricia agestis]|uniref:PC4 and SFRS1-interacting protein n=1 Tax=Aricia agestis TaxID=91739 RepID=UPI001C20266A|nr:PC4 and SFRS1-interacting protein [Aricia agestis]XP_041984911.1 PC4 and SFRS1-interacting protein [Aricia agestis]